MEYNKIAADFPGDSKVWIYQSSKELSDVQVAELQKKATEFASQWMSHQYSMFAQAHVLHNRFLVLVADENRTGASGCSIDKSVAFVKQQGTHLDVDFFDRMSFAFLTTDSQKVEVVSSALLSDWYTAGKINDETLFFDNLVADLSSLPTSWLKPLKNSWHNRFL